MTVPKRTRPRLSGVTISALLLEKVKKTAKKRQTTISSIVEDALVVYLAAPREPAHADAVKPKKKTA
jgi:hypothetical protein